MFDIPSIRVGRVFGIPIEVNLSWIVVFGLVAYSLGADYFPRIPQASAAPVWAAYAVGVVTALGFFGSILAHEVSHSLVAKAESGRVERITLFIFGGVAEIESEPRTPLREFLMAAAGPAMSLVLAGMAFAGYLWAVSARGSWWTWAPLEYLATINFAVAVFNLLPGFPLDGGRVLRSIIWAATGDILTATRWASRSGQLIGWAMVTAAVVGVMSGTTGLVWFGLVGWFIASLAGRSYAQQLVRSRLSHATAVDLMTPSPEYVDGSQSVQSLVDSHVLGSRHTRFPVMLDGAIIGLVTLVEIKTVDRADWGSVTVAEVTDRNLAALTVDVSDSADSLVARLGADRPGALLVVGDGRLRGIVTRADLMRFVGRQD